MNIHSDSCVTDFHSGHFTVCRMNACSFCRHADYPPKVKVVIIDCCASKGSFTKPYAGTNIKNGHNWTLSFEEKKNQMFDFYGKKSFTDKKTVFKSGVHSSF